MSRGFSAELIDGHWTCKTISFVSSFATEERCRHLCHVAWMYRLLPCNGVIVLASFVSN